MTYILTDRRRTLRGVYAPLDLPRFPVKERVVG